MTLPDERYRAVRQARQFLLALLDPKKTPKVPRAIRQRAGDALRHYPGEYDMERVAFMDTEKRVFKRDKDK